MSQLIGAKWLQIERMKVDVKDIIIKLKGHSLISCQIQCEKMKLCESVGFMKDSYMVGDDCFFLRKKSSYDVQILRDTDTIQLYVIQMVSGDMCREHLVAILGGASTLTTFCPYRNVPFQ